MEESHPRTAILWSGDAQLRVDFAARCVFVNDIEVHFTPTEYDVLAYLALHAGTVVSTPEIVREVWGDWYGPMDHVFVHVHHIRRKLGPCGRLIVTKRKAGYLLRRERPAGEDAPAPAPIALDYLNLLRQDAQARGIIWLIVDRSRRVTWVSDSIVALLGWGPEDLLGRPPWEFAHDDEVDGFEARFPLRGGESLLAFDTRLHHADGSVVPIRIAAQVLRGIDGDRVAGIGEWRVIDPQSAVDADGSSESFRLHYGADHVLTSVEPYRPFLGWEPDDVIGTRFSLAGFDLSATDLLVKSFPTSEVDHRLGPSSVLGADGSRVVVVITVHLRITAAELVGYTADVRVMN